MTEIIMLCIVVLAIVIEVNMLLCFCKKTMATLNNN